MVRFFREINVQGSTVVLLMGGTVVQGVEQRRKACNYKHLASQTST